MRYIFSILLCGMLQTGFSQIIKTVGISYTNGTPIYTPAKAGSALALDTVTWRYYTWNGSTWLSDGFRVQTISGCSAPAYTPTKFQSLVVINACNDAQGGPEIYKWSGSVWEKSGGTEYTAGAGIAISGGNVISNTAPDQTVVISDGTGIDVTGTYPNFTVTNTAPNVVQELSIAGQDLALSGGGGTVTLPSATVSEPENQLVYGGPAGVGVDSDTTLKYAPKIIPGTLTNSVLQMGRNLNKTGAAGILSSIYINNKYGYYVGGAAPGRSFNVPIWIENPTSDSYSVPWAFTQQAVNNNVSFGGISGTTDSSYNNVMKMGFNPDGVFESSRQGLWDAWEPSWGNGGQAWAERHMSVRGGGATNFSALGTGERRFATWVGTNLNNASNYSAAWNFCAESHAFNHFKGTTNVGRQYALLSRDFSSGVAAFSLTSNDNYSLQVRIDSAQNLVAISNTSGTTQKASSNLYFTGFNRTYFQDNLGVTWLENVKAAETIRFGTASTNNSYFFQNLSMNSGYRSVFSGNLTSSLSFARGHIFVSNAAQTAGAISGYRSDANFFFLQGFGGSNVTAYSSSFRKFSFGRDISAAYPKGSAFYNIYSEQANTTPVLLLQTSTDSVTYSLASSDPNGLVSARPGSVAQSAAGDQYIKDSGTGNTGWLATAKVRKATATLDFSSTSAGTSSDLTITVTGAVVGDAVSVSIPATPDANSCFTAWVSTANTVTVRFNNYSASPIDPASGTYNVIVTKY